MDNEVGVCLCTIGLPGLDRGYLNNWLSYHKFLGFDHIYLYIDENGWDIPTNIDYNSLTDDLAHVVLLDGSPTFTLDAYQDCYNHYRAEWDWMAFIDMTEWIVVKDERTIRTILTDKRYNQFEAIRLNLMTFTDQEALAQDLNIVEMMDEGGDYEKSLGMAKSIVNCVTNGLKMGVYSPTRNGRAVTQCLPNLTPVQDKDENHALKGVQVNGIDTSLMYVTSNMLEVQYALQGK